MAGARSGSADATGPDLANRVAIGALSLNTLPAKTRRAVARELIKKAQTSKVAERALLVALKGPLPGARTIARPVGQGKVRAILFRSWAQWLAETRQELSEAGHTVGFDTVATRVRWMITANKKVKHRVDGHDVDAVVSEAISLALAVLDGELRIARDEATEALSELIMALSARPALEWIIGLRLLVGWSPWALVELEKRR